MARIPFVTETSDLTQEQRRVVDGILGRRGGRIPGPFRFSLHCPAITEAWHPLGEVLRLKSGFPLRLSEFAILMAARGMFGYYTMVSMTILAHEMPLQDGAKYHLAKRA